MAEIKSLNGYTFNDMVARQKADNNKEEIDHLSVQVSQNKKDITGAKSDITKINKTINSLPETIPTKTSELINDSNFVSEIYVDEQIDELKEDISQLNVTIDKDDLGLYQDEETGMVYPTYKEQPSVNGIKLTGGGSGGIITSTIRLRNLLDSNNLIVPYTNEETEISSIIKYSFSSIDSDGVPTGNGTIVYEVNGEQKYTSTIQQGETSFDIGKYLKLGKANSVKVIVTDSEDNKKSISYSITTTLNKVTSEFPSLSKQTDSFSIPYTPIGIGAKTVHFFVDGDEVATKVVNTSNREQYQTFSLTHGSHIINIYMTTVIDGYSEQVTSNNLQFAVMYCEDGNNTPILLVEPITDTNVLQYSQLSINFMVYGGNAINNKVDCYVDKNKVTTLTISEDTNTWKYRTSTIGEHKFKLVFGELSEEFTLNVTEVDVAQAETSGLKFYLNPLNRSNSEENPEYYIYINEDEETYHINFNDIKFVDGLDGWTGNSLLIPVGSSIDIGYKPFEEDVTTTNGKTLEINFKVSDVYDYGTKIISCYANDKGVFITPNNGSLAISSNNLIEVPFSDNEDIKLTIVISKRNVENEGQKQLIYVYANGVISGVLKYSINDNFSQINADAVHIGSGDATIEVYNARFYNVELSSYQVLDNFIADAKDPNEMVERNDRNQIFNQNNMVDYDLLPKHTPYLIIKCPELPQYKGDKKTGVSGEFVDKANPSKSFTFDGAEFDVQGTSSAGYFVKNFKGKFKNGFNINGQHSDTYALTDDDLPVSTFCFKADVASSEGANNVVLMKLWEETTPYKTEPQKTDNRVRQVINGRPIVVYWENTDTGELFFRGKYNFNNDKSTQNTFGFTDGCECWEFKDNGLALTEFSDDDFSNWENAFEARYPDKNKDTTNLQRVVSWVVSTDPNQSTKSNLPSPVTYNDVVYDKDTVDYRLAKFKNEFEDYFIKSSVLYYYIYTDLFLMVDSRAKNQFITTYDGEHWLFIPYDGDTALGIDNVGKLKFGYWLEDTDQVNGQDVYNGQQSVLWNNVRRVFGDDIEQIAQEVISKGKLNCDYVKNAFNTHQSAWSEAVFCADTEVKYINPYLTEGTLAYLDMAQGSKRPQRDCWLRDRFQYWNSKYNVGSSRDKYITLRVSQPSTSTIFVVEPSTDMHITPYKNTYLNVSFGQTVKQKKGVANEVTDIVSTLDNPRDTPVYIYNAESIKSLNDLSAAYVGYCNVASATNLEDIKLGSGKEGYFNEALTTLGLGNNTKLKLINVRNCINLSGELNAKGCVNIEEVYADGTQITSVTLPDSGRLRILSLPNTITSLIIKNQTKLYDFNIASYDNIQTLVLNNTPNIDSLDIVNKCNNLTNVTLKNINWTIDNVDVLERLSELDGISDNNSATSQSILTGKVHIPRIQSSLVKKYNRIWKDLVVEYEILVAEFTVTFVDYMGNELCKEYIEQFQPAYDPIEQGLCKTPTKPSTIETVYTFDRWSIDFSSSVIADTVVTPIFTESTRQYTVNFYSDTLASSGEIIATYVVNAHDTVVFDRSYPRRTGLEEYGTFFIFDSWDKDTSNIVNDMDVFPNFITCVAPLNPVDDLTQYDYLYTDVDTKTSAYTFAELYAICHLPTEKCKKFLSVGNEICLTMDSSIIGAGDATIVFQVWGFNHFEKTNIEATQTEDLARVVFGMKGLTSTYIKYSGSNTGGWTDSDCSKSAKEFVENTFYRSLPLVFKNNITEIKVLSSAGNQSIDIVNGSAKTFIPSIAEVFNLSSLPFINEVSQYAESLRFPIFTTTSSMIKKTYNGEGTAQSYGTRSPSAETTTNFEVITNSGNKNATYNNSYRFCCGFCLG